MEFTSRASAPGTIMGTETLPAVELKTFRFHHPAGKELDLLVRRIVPWNPSLD